MTFCVAMTIYPMTIYGASYLVYGFRGVSPYGREDLAEQDEKSLGIFAAIYIQYHITSLLALRKCVP